MVDPLAFVTVVVSVLRLIVEILKLHQQLQPPKRLPPLQLPSS